MAFPGNPGRFMPDRWRVSLVYGDEKSTKLRRLLSSRTQPTVPRTIQATHIFIFWGECPLMDVWFEELKERVPVP